MPFSWLSFAILVICTSCRGQDVLKYSILEELPLLSIIGNVKEDSNLRATASAEDFVQITFSVLTTGKTYETYFKIDSSNGTLFTVERIDRETISDCQFKVACVISLNVAAKSKISAFFRTLKINITVGDINDHSPVFPVANTSIHVSELATIGSSFTLPGAADNDIGNNSLQRYYILGGYNLNLPFTTLYETLVDGTSIAKLEVIGALDRETKDSYTVVIVAEDGGNPKLTDTMTVDVIIDDVNDNAPIFTQSLYNVTLNETSRIGDEVLKVTATDADIGVNGEVVYTLSKNQAGQIQVQFKIDENTGVLSVNVNFTSGGQYKVIIEASDKGIPPIMSQTAVFVNVLLSNNNSPIIKVNLFSDDNVARISENADIGTVVVYIMVLDRDPGANGIITCDINSYRDQFGLQNLALNEFKVTVSKAFDRETKDFYNVVVNCSDEGLPPKNDSVEFNVQVTDENDNSPIFLRTIYNVDVEENNDVNAKIVKVSAADKDIGDNGKVVYSLLTTENYQFTIDPLTGVISTQSVFDRESNHQVIVYAYAKDNGIPARTGTATVVINVRDQNDNDPKFSASLYEFSVSENLPSRTTVGTINASDADNNSELTFHIESELPFNIDTSGIIRTTESLDRELKSTYNFIITVFDHGTSSRSSSTSVIVHIDDVNDCAPKFICPDSDNYTVEIVGDAKPHEIVATIKGYDSDFGFNSQLLFSILNPNDSNLLQIDGRTGVITLTRSVLETDRDSYNVVLQVNDNGTPMMNATTSLNILIIKNDVKSMAVANKGENILIAIVLGAVTLVVVVTIIVIICVLNRKGYKRKKETDSKDTFYEKEKPSNGRRVQFCDLQKDDCCKANTNTVVVGSTATFVRDSGKTRESDRTSPIVNLERPAFNQHTVTKETLCPSLKYRTSDPYDAQRYMQCTPISRDDNQPRCQNNTRSDVQLATTSHHKNQLTTVLATFVHDDNHSQISGETITSDSGRGGSESDINSAILSQSHDSDLRQMDNKQLCRPVHRAMMDNSKTYLNLVDLRSHDFQDLPHGTQQLTNDCNHILKFHNLKNKHINNNSFQGGLYIQNDTNFDRTKFQSMKLDLGLDLCSPPPPSDFDPSFTTYDEDDDDGISTTTSGSYIIDHEDVSHDFRLTLPSAAGLRGYLV